jgi:hypothetical protein
LVFERRRKEEKKGRACFQEMGLDKWAKTETRRYSPLI